MKSNTISSLYNDESTIAEPKTEKLTETLSTKQQNSTPITTKQGKTEHIELKILDDYIEKDTLQTLCSPMLKAERL